MPQSFCQNQLIKELRLHLNFSIEQFGLISMLPKPIISVLCTGNNRQCLVSEQIMNVYLSNSMALNHIAFHNHTDNNCDPSYQDYKETKRLILFFKSRNKCLVDHIIITKNESFIFSMHFKKMFS